MTVCGGGGKLPILASAVNMRASSHGIIPTSGHFTNGSAIRPLAVRRRDGRDNGPDTMGESSGLPMRDLCGRLEQMDCVRSAIY